MHPVALDLSRLKVALVGNGAAAARRLALLDADGASQVRIYALSPSPDLVAAAGPRLLRRLPRVAELAETALVFVADLEEGLAAEVAALARACGALVNVEDRKAFCDFHSVSVIRRGDLTIAISTNGASPGLAKRLRRHLERAIPREWRGRAEAVAARRREWRRQGKSPAEVAEATDSFIERRGWLP